MEHLNSLPANEKTSVHPGNLFDTFLLPPAKRAEVEAYRDGNPQRPAAVNQLEVETGCESPFYLG